MLKIFQCLDPLFVQDFDKMMEDHVDFQEHNFGQTVSKVLIFADRKVGVPQILLKL